MGGSEQLNLTASGSRDAALERHASKKIADLNLSVRTLSCLADAGIVTVADLVRKSPDELMLLPLFGRKSLDEITAFLAQLGLELECRKAAGES
jgi:DNA-directed RNA polymerase subunit alpha